VTERLPLFPLGTVLYPGLLLPLHVFEERYRQLVRDLVGAPEERRRFGVVAIREGREVGADGLRALHPVGCVARLRQVEPFADGRFEIVSTGAERFRLTDLDTSRPYLQGDVDLLREGGPDVDPVLVAEVARLFTAYRGALGGEDSALPDDPLVLSYLVAAATVLDLTDKQALLEAPAAAERLEAERALLRRETALVALLPSMPAVELTRAAVSPN
jgi:Lon protease-like protein